jgi:hypothetical protein
MNNNGRVMPPPTLLRDYLQIATHPDGNPNRRLTERCYESLLRFTPYQFSTFEVL